MQKKYFSIPLAISIAIGMSGCSSSVPESSESNSQQPSVSPTTSEVAINTADSEKSAAPTPDETLDFTEGMNGETIEHEKMKVDYEAFADWESLDLLEKVVVADKFFAANGVDITKLANDNDNGKEILEWYYPRYIAVQKLALDTSAERNEEIAIMLSDALALPTNDENGSHEKYQERFSDLAYDAPERNHQVLSTIYSYSDGMQRFSASKAGNLIGKTVSYDTKTKNIDEDTVIAYQERFAYKEVYDVDGKIQGYWFSVLRETNGDAMSYGDEPPVVLATPSAN